MPIVARDLDVSEKKLTFHAYIQGTGGGTFFPGTGAGQTYLIAVMPFPFEVVSVASSVRGLSGTPNLQLQNYRFIPGTGGGATMYGAMNASFALAAVGTSGVQYSGVNGWSLPSAGSTILQGQAGDVLTLVSVGANTAATEVTVSVIVKKLQDIASYFGVST